jgi:hypothetical protein
MARKATVEIVGGLYQVLTLGNDRPNYFSFRLSITTRRLPQGDLYDPTNGIVGAYKRIEVQEAQYRRLDPIVPAGNGFQYRIERTEKMIQSVLPSLCYETTQWFP